MCRPAIAAAVLLCAAYAWAAISDRAIGQSLLAEARNSAQSGTERSWSGQELSPEYYKKLRAQALASAEVRLSPQLKNPGISQGGLDPAVVEILQEQRAYLGKPTPSASRFQMIAGSAQSTNYDVYTSSLAAKNKNPDPLAQSADPRSRNPKDLASWSTCRAPMIRSVNGRGPGAIFTPQTPNNSYRIEGCFFGALRGQLQLEPHPSGLGQSAQPIALQVDNSIDAWSDNAIVAHLDPRLSGFPDDPVTLVIYPGSGQRMELAGCFFVAVRGEPQLLSVLPSAWVKLQASMTGRRSIKQLEYVSPPGNGSEAPSDAANTSAFVVRSDTDNFGTGSDTYDFSHLNSGWAVESIQLQTYTASCPGSITATQSSGRWDTAWGPKSFTVGWEDDFCTSRVSPFFSFSLSVSQYATKVWVIGPVGTQPVQTGRYGLKP